MIHTFKAACKRTIHPYNAHRMMQIIDFIRHIDRHLAQFCMEHGPWVYGLVFLIVFCETGLVILPFLPGDSLLFALGALAARPEMNLHWWLVGPLLFLAALLGDNVNYWIGRRLGPAVFTENRKWLRRDYLTKAQNFYELHGGKAIIMARFVPIVRTFAPFVAGIGHMDYRKFLFFSVIGALAWITICLGAGYALGGFDLIRNNFEMVVLLIIIVSLLPVAIEWWKIRKAASTKFAPIK